MAKTKQSGTPLGKAVEPITLDVLESPTVVKYKLVLMELKTGAFKIFEDAISEQMKYGWKCQGGIDVKTTSVSGWFLTQAMIRE